MGYHYGTVFRYRWNFGNDGGDSNLLHAQAILRLTKSRQTDPTTRINRRISTCDSPRGCLRGFLFSADALNETPDVLSFEGDAVGGEAAAPSDTSLAALISATSLQF